MAFEDRSSPASPGASPGLQQVPNSPESSRTSSYTCTTIQQADKSPIFRIASFALPKTFQDLSDDNTSERSYRSRTTSTCSSRAVVDEDEDEDEVPSPTIQTLKYSIRNILQPEFGRSAVQKTRKCGKIGFKPYEVEAGKEPLGSLCQAVSQIGTSSGTQEEVRPKSPVKEDEPLPGPDEIKNEDGKLPTLWPAWVYCTRYSDRPSSGKEVVLKSKIE